MNNRPLIIDPVGDANHWLKTRLRLGKGNISNTLEQKSVTCIRKLENAVNFGNYFLLEDLSSLGSEGIPIGIQMLLARRTFRENGNDCIKIRDHVVEYDRDFKLYVTTRSEDVLLSSSDVLKYFNIIDFSVRGRTLEHRIQTRAFSFKEPLLYKKEADLLNDIARSRLSISTTEKAILEMIETEYSSRLEEGIIEPEMNTNAHQSIGNRFVMQGPWSSERKVLTPLSFLRPCNSS